MFSQWAAKRVCKFFLKRLLGRILQGELDLDQLEVQLGNGIIQLKDLSLNTDYLNKQIGGLPFVIKEGSVSSISLKVPWRFLSSEHCEVELDGVELLVIPKSLVTGNDTNIFGDHTRNILTPQSVERLRAEMEPSGSASCAYLGVDDGVKMIARMVESILLGLRGKLRNLSVVLGSQCIDSVCGADKPPFYTVLVIHIPYLEYGYESDIDNGDDERETTAPDSVRKLICFRGIEIELTDTHIDTSKSRCSNSQNKVPIIGGKNGELAGHVWLNFPWKGAFHNVPKINIELLLEPLKLKLSLHEVHQMLTLVNAFINQPFSGGERNIQNFPQGLSLENHAVTSASSGNLDQRLLSPDKAYLPESHFIPDWVQSVDDKRHSKAADEDLAASIDEFFECLDGSWLSQASCTGSGIWNWTRSTYNAITTASSLVDGIALASPDKELEYCVKVRLASLSATISDSIMYSGESLETESISPENSVEACLNDLEFSSMASEFAADFKLGIKSIEVYMKMKCQKSCASTHRRVSCTNASSLQGIMPSFPVSLVPSVMSTEQEQADACESILLRVGCSTEEPAFMLSAKCNYRLSRTTDLSVHLQPMIVWIDPCKVKRILKLAMGLGRVLDNSKTLRRHHDTMKGQLVLGQVRKSCLQAKVFLSCLRAVFSFSQISPNSTPGEALVLDLSSSPKINSFPLLLYKWSDDSDKSLVLTVNSIVCYVITSRGRQGNNTLSCIRVMEIWQHDSNGSRSYNEHFKDMLHVEIVWKDKVNCPPLFARQVWESVTSQQKRGDGGRGVGGNNPDFAAAAAATAPNEEDSVQQEIASSCLMTIHVKLPMVRIDLIEVDSTVISDILAAWAFEVCLPMNGHVTVEETIILDHNRSKSSFPRCIMLTCKDITISTVLPRVSCREQSTSTNHCGDAWDALEIYFSTVNIMLGLGIGGDPDLTYCRIAHEDCHIMGLLSDNPCIKRRTKLMLFSCSSDVLGRGDGGGGNALARGASGLVVTFISWPRKQDLADIVVAGTMKGGTLIAHNGRFDWILSLGASIEQCSMSLLQGSHKTHTPSGPKCSERYFFLFDLHDLALSYEPMPEPVVNSSVGNPGKSIKPECGPSSSSGGGPVACILAAAALRVSSKGIDTKGERYHLWLRDLALHLVDTGLKGSTCKDDYTTVSMQHAGYVQVAKEAVMEASIGIGDGENGFLWEVQCANNHLHFDTCHDTTAAFGRLIMQLQQMFAPSIQQPSVCLKTHKLHKMPVNAGAEPDSPSSSSSSGCDEPGIRADGLLEDVLENAFSYTKLCYQGGKCSSHIASGCLDSSSSGFSSHGKLSSLSTQERVLSKDKHVSASPIGEFETVDSPVFIEDYYLTGALDKDAFVHQENGISRPLECTSHVMAEHDGETKGSWYMDGPVDVIDNHVPISKDKSGIEDYTASAKTTNIYPLPVGKVILKDLNARWRLYGGSDWCKGETNRVGRQSGRCIEVLVDEMGLRYDAFPATGTYASSLTVEIRDVRLYDCSMDAPWKMVLGYYRSTPFPRESSSKAVKIKMDAVRPNPLAPLEEYRLSIALLPFRLHLDQRHIDFFVDFFSQPGLSTSSKPSEPCEGCFTGCSSQSEDSSEEAMLPFFQVCEMQPFTIRVDYIPRRMDLAALKGGNYAELLNLVSWKGIELNLKHVHASGVHGWSSLSGILFGEWLEDISQNQVHKFIQGIGPIRPLYAVGSGAAKLVVLPAKHYKKDRRLFRGMRKGAVAFFRSVSLEALSLGAHMTASASHILVQTEVALGGNPNGASFMSEREDVKKTVLQPGGPREGLLQAYESISQGLERSAYSLVGHPMKVYQKGAGAGLAVASAIRASPSAVLAPAAAAMDAVHQALIGVRNGLDPERKRESDEKHCGPPPDISRWQ